MACNCKKKVDLINEKYGDGGKDNTWKNNPITKIILSFHFLGTFFELCCFIHLISER